MNWHPQNFTTWKYPTKLHDGRELLPLLPQLSKSISDIRACKTDASDFEIFDTICCMPAPDTVGMSSRERDEALYNHQMIACETQHYVVRSLAWLEFNAINEKQMTDWRWTKWIRQHGSRITAITSFNYDTVIGRALVAADAEFSLTALNSSSSSTIQVSKPHGSINFEGCGISVPIDYPMQNLIMGNNMPIRLVPDPMTATVDAEIVLPSQSSKIAHYQWVRPGLEAWCRHAKDCSELVICGLSYWECDRDELDQLTEYVSKSADVYFCDPVPNMLWIDKLNSRFSNVHLILDGPPIL